MGVEKRASMVGFGSGVMLAGIAMILHAAIAIMKHRTELKALDIQFTFAPWNVVIECCLGMALCVLGTSSSGAKHRGTIFTSMYTRNSPKQNTRGKSWLLFVVGLTTRQRWHGREGRCRNTRDRWQSR